MAEARAALDGDNQAPASEVDDSGTTPQVHGPDSTVAAPDMVEEQKQ